MLRRHQPDAVCIPVVMANWSAITALFMHWNRTGAFSDGLRAFRTQLFRGNLTIVAKQPIVSSSLSAGRAVSSKVCVKCLACYKRDTSAVDGRF